MKPKTPVIEHKGKEKEYFLCIPFAICVFILILVFGSAYFLYNHTEIKRILFSDNNSNVDDIEEDEIKIQIYLLESNYYLEEIDKEEVDFSYLASDFRKFTRYAAGKKPDCVEKLPLSSVNAKPAADNEEMAKNSIEYFKHILNSWINNIDYMDLDKTLTKLLHEYQDLYFNIGDWKDEKVDKRLNVLKEIYENEMSKIEECTSSNEDDIKTLEKVRKNVKLVNSRLDEKWVELKKLDEELFRTANNVIAVKATCLFNFPFVWEDIQREKILAERAIALLRFKLKQIRYKIMAADTKEKVKFLVKWEENFLNDKLEKHMHDIDMHYTLAKKLQNDTINEIKHCVNK